MNTDSNSIIKYARNISWLLIEKIIRLFVGLFVGVWVTRYMGPANFGLYSYVQAYVSIFAVVATLGMDNIVVRELVKQKDKTDEIMGSAFMLKICATVLFFIILATALIFSSSEQNIGMFVFIVSSSIIFQNVNVIDFYFQSRVLSKYVVYANLISLSLSGILKIVLILIKAPIIYFFWVIVFEAGLICCGLIYFYLTNGNHIRSWRFSKAIAYALLKDSWSLMFSGFVILIYMRIDQIIINKFLGNSATGVYSAAVRLSEAWYFVPMVIANSVFPAIIRAKEQSQELYMKRFQALSSLLCLIAFFFMCLILLFGDFAINLLYGEAYAESSAILKIFFISGIFIAISMASGKWYLVENQTRFLLTKNLAGCILNITLSLIMVNRYGLSGVACATLISIVFATLLMDFFYKNARPAFYVKMNSFILKDLKYILKRRY